MFTAQNKSVINYLPRCSNHLLYYYYFTSIWSEVQWKTKEFLEIFSLFQAPTVFVVEQPTAIPSSKNIVTGMLVVYFEEHFAQLSFLSVHQFLVRDCWIISCLLSLSTLDRQCFSSSPGFTFHKDSFKNTITSKFKCYLNTELNFVRYWDQHLNTGHVNTGHLYPGQGKFGYSDIFIIQMFVVQILTALLLNVN